jgi:poly-gamma-glutamate synthesis protein (capsule biosynthesis protein)
VSAAPPEPTCVVPAYTYPLCEKLVWPFQLLFPSTRNPLGVRPLAVPRGNLQGKVLGFIGDIMPLPDGSTAQVDDRLKAVLHELDALVCNLEAPILDDASYHRPVSGLKLAFSRALARRALEALGTDPARTYVSVANNHAADYGAVQFQHTVDYVQSLGYQVIGVWPDTVPVIELDALRIGLVPWSYWMNRSWEAPCDSPRPVIRTDILGTDFAGTKTTQKLDYLVGYSHWQFEFKHFPRRPFVELAEQLARAGMDVNVGGHPHVLGPLAVAGNGLVHCSLGNFVGLHPRWPMRLGGIMRMFLDAEAGSLSAAFDMIPTFMTRGNGGARVTGIDQLAGKLRERCTRRLGLLYPPR